MKECPACHRCFPDSVNHCPSDGDGLRFLFAGEPLLDSRYQIERKVGHGGMGMVFKARHVFLKTTHAVKVILPDLVGNDPTLTTRFRQEAMAAAAIRHPHTVSVTDYGVIGGTTPYLVMEFVEGRSLHDLLTQERRLPAALAVEIALAVCEGVAAAHRIGIVHRDLKPLNILLREGESPREGVKVLDFGLAKIKSSELLGSFVAAQTQGLMGSPFYMAPEQWGDDDVDVRADIYSLGVILYQMLAGDVPFAGRSIPSIMNKHLTAAPVPLSERGADVPPAVERVVRRALEKEPARRQQTVDELMAELREALATVAAADPAAAGARTIPPGPQQTGTQLKGSAAEGAGTRRHDEDGIDTAAGGPGFGPGLGADTGADRGADRGAAPPPSVPPVPGEWASGGAPRASADPAPAAPPEGGPGHDPGPVTSRPQAGRTSPVTRADERLAPQARATRHGAEAPTEPLPPSPGVSSGPFDGDAREAELQDLGGVEAQRLADEAARRAREAGERRRAAEESERRRELEAERRRAAEEEERRHEAEEQAAAAARGQTPAAVPPGTDARGEAGAVPRAAVAAAGAGSHSAGVSAIEPGPGVTADTRGPAAPRLMLLAAGAVVLLLALGGLAYFLSLKGGAPETPKSEETPRPRPSATAAPASGAEAVAVLPGGSFRVGRDDVPPLTEEAKRARPRYMLWMYQQWPSRPVTVGPFAIDKTEVTNEEYAEFVSQTGHPPPPDIWGGAGGPAAHQLRLPVTNVNYSDALAFAAWRSKRDGVTYRLPTEEEWEYAARGGDLSRAFPWGASWSDGRANLGGSGPAPVGSFATGETPQGVSDMIGNVWELTSTEAGMYEGNDKTEIEPADRGGVVVRGGSYQSRPDGDEPVTATSRRWVRRDFRSPTLGFRLVRPAP